ncbi:MAG: (2Fe-2S) ferredoxin domain-containing protein [Fimbriimonadaceae bacterium]|nr:(2Fe-2S) ferredoxin domain-containing protein [Alphaproteobacteria bacterium]
MAKPEKHVLLCGQSRPEDHPKGSCAARGAGAVADKFRAEFESRELWGRFKFSTTSCLGACEQGPVVIVYPDAVMYQKIGENDVARIIDEHLLGGKPVDDLKAPAEIWG